MNEKLASTSALAKKMNLSSKDLFSRLQSAELVDRVDDSWRLTPAGEKIGGVYKKHPQYGEYIAWPESIIIPEGVSCVTATVMGKDLNISPSRINYILSELGWLEKAVKGWKLTPSGIKAGGIQKEDYRSGVPYVTWHNGILQNQAFKDSIASAQGHEITETKTADSSDDDFRKKYEAKHRATDGHYVRSKAEMLVDNWLYMAEIVHAYERRLPIEEEVYCDFYLPVGKVYIEYWGYENDSKYLARKRQKQEIYKKYGFNLIELEEKDVQNLDDKLPKLLLRFGIQAY
jgi:hypothetical protein